MQKETADFRRALVARFQMEHGHLFFDAQRRVADALSAHLVRIEGIESSHARHDAGSSDQFARPRVLEHEKILFGTRRFHLLRERRFRLLELRLEKTVLVWESREAADDRD